jgi:hypothetical protein
MFRLHIKDERVMMDTRRAIVVVESMVGMEGYMRIFTLKMDR